MKKDDSYYSGLVLLAAVLWGTTGTTQAFAPAGASSLSIGAVRLMVGAAALILAASFKGSMKDRRLWLNRFTLLAAISVAAYQLLFFAGVRNTGVATGTIVTIGSAPIFAGLASLLFKRTNPGLLWLAATLMSVIGCVLLVTGGQAMEVNASGVLLNLGAGFAYAMYSAMSKELLKNNSAVTVTGTVFAIGSLLLLPVLITSDPSWLVSLRGLATALHLGLLATALPYLLYTMALARIPFPKAVTLTLAEPVTAALLGLLVLQEHLPPISLLGMGFVFSGLVILSAGQLLSNRFRQPEPGSSESQ